MMSGCRQLSFSIAGEKAKRWCSVGVRPFRSRSANSPPSDSTGRMRRDTVVEVFGSVRPYVEPFGFFIQFEGRRTISPVKRAHSYRTKRRNPRIDKTTIHPRCDMRDLKGIRLAGAAAVIALSACATMTVNQATEEAAIRAAETEYMAAVNAHDANRLLAVHAPDAVLMLSNSPLSTGTTAIRSSFTDFFSQGSPTLSFTPTRIEVTSPTTAYDYGTYTLNMNTPQGQMTDRGNYTTLWRKINGQWRIALDAPVTSTPMAGATAMASPMYSPDVHIVSNGGLPLDGLPPPGLGPRKKAPRIHGGAPNAREHHRPPPFPPRDQIPGHWPPGAEDLTLGSGTFQLAMGNTANWNALQNYGPGDYLYIPPRHSHFGGSPSTGPSVIQLHGMGPFQVIVGPGM